MTSFPNELSAFIPLIDGHHPYAASTHNELAEAIERIEKALGAGRSQVYGDILGNTSNGPKGRNASVRERLDQFVDTKGRLKGLIVKSGEGIWGQLSELGKGLEVQFGRNIGNWRVYEQDSYVGILQIAASEITREGAVTAYSKHTPALWWMAERLPDRCYFQARTMDCQPIPINDETELTWSAFILTGETPGIRL